MHDERLTALRIAAKDDEQSRRVLIDYYLENRRRVRRERGYSVTRYPGKIDSLAIGSAYFLLSDGRISRSPAQSAVQMVGVAISRTTIALTGAPICFGNDRMYDLQGAIEHQIDAPVMVAGVIRVAGIPEAP